MELVDDPRRAAVADPEPALEQRRGAALVLDARLRRLAEQGVALARLVVARSAFALRPPAPAPSPGCRPRSAGRLQRRAARLAPRRRTTPSPSRCPRCRCRRPGAASARSCPAAGTACRRCPAAPRRRSGPGSCGCPPCDATRNAIRLGKFALIRPVITFTDGRWVARMRWMPIARAFCASMRERRLHLGLHRHHQVGQLVDDDDDDRQHAVGVGLFRRRLGRRVGSLGADGDEGDLGTRRIPERLGLLDLAVEVGQVAGAVGLEQLVAPVHLEHRPLEHRGRVVVVGHHLVPQVGERVVHRELHHLRDRPSAAAAPAACGGRSGW